MAHRKGADRNQLLLLPYKTKAKGNVQRDVFVPFTSSERKIDRTIGISGFG